MTDPTQLPEGFPIISADDDDSGEADQAGCEPTPELIEQLHGIAWQAAADAQVEGLI